MPLGFVLLELSAGCASRKESDLRGTIDASLSPGGAFRVQGPPGKLRAQVEDDGVGCSFHATIESEDRAQSLQITTYADEVAALLGGQAQDVVASDHATRSVSVNAATVYLRIGDRTLASRSGTIAIERLPAPKAPLRVRFRGVVMHEPRSGTSSTFEGEATLTYVGAVRVGNAAGRACPGIALAPSDVVY